ncbi:MucR family transcriptional regulator [Methylobacterium sp. J-070]|uniref:MucR family transcriptional regulator n=1 Tax=Methylobacterium sp. J-070 TaxID=2836650 RepID=UPI001FBC0D29|nr:MucR family transcriptional regulator [Methylobacterium sp. J-070]MCJ2054770.1 MucR family transcriptional regulator [Methylobacterium sp. J-070]
MNKVVEIIGPRPVGFIELTADIVAAYVSNNSVRPADMAELIASTHAALAGLGNAGTPATPVPEKLTPAQIRKSITPDALISFIDGKPYKTLKRHLTGNGMTVEQYRERFGLPRDYPSTAANYSAQRSALAKNLGLGQQRRKAAPKAAEVAATVSEKPKRGGRPRKAKDAAEA